MQPIPTPADVFVATLTWLGVPALVLLPFLTAFALAEWVTFGAATARVSQRIAHASSVQVQRMIATKWPAAVTLALAQTVLIASAYSLCRLVYAMGIEDANGRNIADGSSFTFSELWVKLTEYSGESQAAVNVALASLGWVLALNVANLTRSRTAVGLLKAPLFVVVPLSILGAVGLGIVGFMTWSLATWLGSPGYTLDMVWLYVIWVALLSLIALTSALSGRLSGKTFGGRP